MSEHCLLIVLHYTVFIAEHGEGMAAVMGSMLFQPQEAQRRIHGFSERLYAVRQIGTPPIKSSLYERDDSAVDRNDAVLPCSRFHTALEISFFQICLLKNYSYSRRKHYATK